MRADPLGFWHSHKGLRKAEEDDEELFLVAELRLLANAAGDRAEMHAILAQQRDNWNKLFQRMLSAATMTACVLGGLDGQAHSLSLSLPALLLNAGCAAMMAVINHFQPSQLAEEQRTAARLFRKLASDVDYALQVAPHLRQHTPLLLRDSRRRLEALDKAYPMPLTPGGLEKFPAKVVPPVLIAPADDHYTETSIFIDDRTTSNGWDGRATADLEHVATLLRGSDIKTYTSWAQNLVNVNKCLAVAAPIFASSAAVLNGMSSMGLGISNLGVLAAMCSVLAAFAASFSHDMQLGMVFELYRNSAGYYADIETSIQETLRAPLEQRENGVLFRQRVAYQLGRSTAENDRSPIVPADSKAAGTLF